MSARLRRIYETVRRLKAKQVVYRLIRKYVRKRPPKAIPFTLRSQSATWVEAVNHKQTMLNRSCFRFIGQTIDVGNPTLWDSPEIPLLWRYNLHYFEDLVALDSDERRDWHRDLIGRWIADNPCPIGTAWAPYPTSLRIANWIKWTFAGNRLEPAWQASLALQAEWLSRNIEWHLLGNHLFENAKALFLAGLFFETDESRRWLALACQILDHELGEQILPDGGHFERSPMYHCIILEDVLDMINASRCYGVLEVADMERRLVYAAQRMLEWLRANLHDDGGFALFNDSAFGISAEPPELFFYASRLGLSVPNAVESVEYSEESGYVRAESSGAVLLADVGKIGPDYLPGHAHADTLGFEFSISATRLIVDTGCSTYEAGEERLRQRGTSAHNTVMVDGADSSEVWSSFRVARRARPHGVSVRRRDDCVEIEGSHDGYQRLPGRVTHRRRWQLASRQLTIADSLDGRFESAVANFLLAPDVRAEEVDDAVILGFSDGEVVMRVSGGVVNLESSTWHPEFGLSIPTTRIAIEFEGDRLSTTLSW